MHQSAGPDIDGAYELALPQKVRGTVRMSYFLPPPAFKSKGEPNLGNLSEEARSRMERLVPTSAPGPTAWTTPPTGRRGLSDDHRLSRRVRESSEVLREARPTAHAKRMAFRLPKFRQQESRIAIFPINSARLVDFRTGISSLDVEIDLREVRLANEATFREWAEAEGELERLRAEGGEPVSRRAAGERMQAAMEKMAKLQNAGDVIEFCYGLGQSSRKGVDPPKSAGPDDPTRRSPLVEQIADQLFGVGSAGTNPFFTDDASALEVSSGEGKVSRLVRPFITACLQCGGPTADAPRETAAFLLCRQFRETYRIRDLDAAGTASLESTYSGRTFAFSPRGACAVLAPDEDESEASPVTAWSKTREPMALVARAELEYLLWELQRADTDRTRGLPAYPQSFQPFWKRAGKGQGWWTSTRILLGLAERPESEKGFDPSLESLESQQKRLLEYRLYHQVVSASTEPEHEGSFVACRAGLGLERLERHADRTSEEISEYLEQVESRREAAMQSLFGRMGALLAFVGLMLALTDVLQNLSEGVWWRLGILVLTVGVAITLVNAWYGKWFGPRR